MWGLRFQASSGMERAQVTGHLLPSQNSYHTEIGQTLDLITAPVGNVDLGRFTEKR